MGRGMNSEQKSIDNKQLSISNGKCKSKNEKGERFFLRIDLG